MTGLGIAGLLRGYGRALTAVFFGAVAFWVLMLIVLPQLTVFESALRPAPNQTDATAAEALSFDADTCISVLKTHLAAPVPGTGPAAMAPPAIGVAPASPAPFSPPAIGVAPSAPPAKATAVRPYILHCDRATTTRALVRAPDEPARLHETYGLPELGVDPALPIPEQIAQAERIRDLAAALRSRLKAEEAAAPPYTAANFAAIPAARLIPMTPEVRAESDASLEAALLTATGLRFVKDGEVHMRLTLVILARTLVYAVLATGLALLLCYPIAVKLALATAPERQMWLLLGLVIPYAIAELMRVYAWTAIIDNRGVLNSVLDWLGFVELEAGDYIAFKRAPLTVFVVVVYTYILFMVFPILNVMTTLDRNQIEAARDLGASTWRVHRRIVIPHCRPGIAVGCIATFMLCAGAFSVPRIISSGLQAEWFAQTIYNKFFESQSTNAGAAYVAVFTLVCFLIVALFMRLMRTRLADFARV